MNGRVTHHGEMLMRTSTLVQNAGGLERGRLQYNTPELFRHTLLATTDGNKQYQKFGTVF